MIPILIIIAVGLLLMGGEVYAIKKNVDIRFLRPEITRILPNVKWIFEKHAPPGYVFTITAGRDGVHMNGSKHYKDLAVDLRIRDDQHNWFDGPTLDAIQKDIKTLLGDDYQVVLHPLSHLHLEYDP
jgi:hypothetical protein